MRTPSPSSLTLVARLFFSRRPATVSRLVVPVVIVSLDCVLGRGLWTHIGQECGEVFPSLTNYYSASPVVVEILVRRVSATRDHSAPGLPFRTFESAVDRRSVTARAGHALRRAAGFQVSADDVDFSAARAETVELPLAGLRYAAMPKHGKLAKCLSAKVFSARHRAAA